VERGGSKISVKSEISKISKISIKSEISEISKSKPHLTSPWKGEEPLSFSPFARGRLRGG